MGIGRLFRSYVVFIFRKAGQSNGRNLVEGLDLVLALFVIGQISVGLPDTSSVFDLDIVDRRRLVAEKDSSSSCSSSTAAVALAGGSGLLHEFVQGGAGRNHDGGALNGK